MDDAYRFSGIYLDHMLLLAAIAKKSVTIAS
jgi:hypothetical protein